MISAADVVPAMRGLTKSAQLLRDAGAAGVDGAGAAAAIDQALPAVADYVAKFGSIGALGGIGRDLPEMMSSLADAGHGAALSGLQPIGGFPFHLTQLSRQVGGELRHLQRIAPEFGVRVPDDLRTQIQTTFAR